VNVDLPFIVGGAAAVQIAAANRWLEGRGRPQVQRLGRLHVVVAVEQDGRLAGRVQRFSIDKRVHFRRQDFDIFQACGAQAAGDPFRSALNVGLVFGLRADTRNS
jgi:hypothetical protein